MNATHDPTEPLKRKITEVGGVLTVWGVLREDTYETCFGDGYYAYLPAATLEEAEERHMAATIQEHMVKWHVRHYELGLADGVPVLLTEVRQFEPVDLATITAALAYGELAK
jgi:hypothetical protein